MSMLNEFIDALTCLPGIGPKSAQRIAFHLLERARDSGLHLASLLTNALTHIKHCESCRNFSEFDRCLLCQDTRRDKSVVCIVENPVDILAIEQIHVHRGMYFVLMGHLSPIDGIGPEELGIPLLLKHFQDKQVRHVILATSATVEGETTAHYISTLAKKHQITLSRIAYGIPVGGELNMIDSSTLAHAFSSRTQYE